MRKLGEAWIGRGGAPTIGEGPHGCMPAARAVKCQGKGDYAVRRRYGGRSSEGTWGGRLITADACCRHRSHRGGAGGGQPAEMRVVAMNRKTKRTPAHGRMPPDSRRTSTTRAQDPCPRAAFDLGVFIAAMPLFHKLWEGRLSDVTDMMSVLAGEIDPGVRDEMQSKLAVLERLEKTVFFTEDGRKLLTKSLATESVDRVKGRDRSGVAKDVVRWVKVSKEFVGTASDALRPVSPYRVWFDLGLRLCNDALAVHLPSPYFRRIYIREHLPAAKRLTVLQPAPCRHIHPDRVPPKCAILPAGNIGIRVDWPNNVFRDRTKQDTDACPGHLVREFSVWDGPAESTGFGPEVHHQRNVFWLGRLVHFRCFGRSYRRELQLGSSAGGSLRNMGPGPLNCSTVASVNGRPLSGGW